MHQTFLPVVYKFLPLQIDPRLLLAISSLRPPCTVINHPFDFIDSPANYRSRKGKRINDQGRVLKRRCPLTIVDENRLKTGYVEVGLKFGLTSGRISGKERGRMAKSVKQARNFETPVTKFGGTVSCKIYSPRPPKINIFRLYIYISKWLVEPRTVVLHFKSVKTHACININNTLNDYHDRYDITLFIFEHLERIERIISFLLQKKFICTGLMDKVM